MQVRRYASNPLHRTSKFIRAVNPAPSTQTILPEQGKQSVGQGIFPERIIVTAVVFAPDNVMAALSEHIRQSAAGIKDGN